MAYRVFKPNNPGCNAIKQEIREKLNEFLKSGETGKQRIEKIYREAFGNVDRESLPDAEKMVAAIMENHQSQSGELLAEVRKPIIIGVYCEFDFSRMQDRAGFVQQAVGYVDRQVPRLFDTLGVPIPLEKVQLRFEEIKEGGGYFTPPRSIAVDDNLKDNDLGCFTHECVHWVQQSGGAAYHDRQKIFEGVADYYRIVLSENHRGDYFNDGKRNLVAHFSLTDLYDSGSEFIAYLRRASGNPQFVKELNDCLRTNDIAAIDRFFPDHCGDNFDRLHVEYQRNRETFVGDRPQDVNRYGYFTEMA